MGRYRATRSYRSNHNGRNFAFDPGSVSEVEDDVAEWVNRDSPGTLERQDTPEAVAEPKPEVEAPAEPSEAPKPKPKRGKGGD